MNVREKLVELLCEAQHIVTNTNKAEYLVEHGVTVQELDGCLRCKDTSKMTVTISNKLVDGVNTGWIGGNLPARFCPFCGRRLPEGE